MRGSTFKGFVTGLGLAAVFAVGASVATRLPERLAPPVPISDPPSTDVPTLSTPTAEVAVPQAPTKQAERIASARAPASAAPATPPGTAPVLAETQSAPVPSTDVAAVAPVQPVAPDASVPVAPRAPLSPPAPRSATGEQPVTPQADPGVAAIGSAAPAPDPTFLTETGRPPVVPSADTADDMSRPAPSPAPAGVTAPSRPSPAVPGDETVHLTEAAPAPQGETRQPVVRRLVSAQDAPAQPAIGRPASDLIARADAVPVRRPGSVQAATTASDAAQPEAEPTPFARYRLAFTPPEAGTVISVVLIHDGIGPVGPDVLKSFEFPVTVAVDASLGNAADLMRAYRANGAEVFALADLPPETSAFDAELAVQAILGRMDEVAGVIEGTGSGLQSARFVADQVALYLASSGHGLVLRENGLNTTLQLAQREGVPAGLIYRDIDGAGQDERAIRRFLDQAAFQARNRDGVIVLARMRPETITALLVWSLEDRATEVVLAPVSAQITP